jgi:excisionase family DNA binding protein
MSMRVPVAPPECITVQEAAELAGVHDRTIRRWIYLGHLVAQPSPGPRIGKAWNRLWVSRDQLEELISRSLPTSETW